jgi:hypothetical protein
MKNRLYLSLIVVAALCLAGWTVHAQLQRSSPARQTWEYKTITMGRVASGAVWSSWSEDGKQLPLPVDAMVKRAELGNQGWELVAVNTMEDSPMDARGVPSTFTTILVQYYKRPR